MLGRKQLDSYDWLCFSLRPAIYNSLRPPNVVSWLKICVPLCYLWENKNNIPSINVRHRDTQTRSAPEVGREPVPLTLQTVRKAKSLEALDSSAALDAYQEAFNVYCDLENIIDEVTPDLHWARVRFSVRKVLQVLLWVLSAVASGFISILLADLF